MKDSEKDSINAQLEFLLAKDSNKAEILINGVNLAEIEKLSNKELQMFLAKH